MGTARLVDIVNIMHWIIVGICIGIGLMLARPILIMLTYAVVTVLAFAIAGAVIAIPAAILRAALDYIFP